MPDSARHPLRGVMLMLAALFFFAILDATSKYLAQSFALPLLIWARYTLHCLLMLIFLGPSLRLRLLRTRRPLLQIARAVLLVAMSLLVLAAIRIMPLAETTAILLLTPLLVAPLAARFLGERIGTRRWLAMGIGVCGALLVARPGGGASPAGVLYALAAAFCSAIYMVQTRQLSTSENSLTMLFYTAITGSALMSLSLPWVWAEPMPSLGQALAIASLGVCGATGHYLMTRAFHHATATTLSPLSNLQLLWATLLGWLVFAQLPDAWSIVGMLVIVASGLLIAMDERTARPATAPE